jgi:hypothetical protein
MVTLFFCFQSPLRFAFLSFALLFPFTTGVLDKTAPKLGLSLVHIWFSSSGRKKREDTIVISLAACIFMILYRFVGFGLPLVRFIGVLGFSVSWCAMGSGLN